MALGVLAVILVCFRGSKSGAGDLQFGVACHLMGGRFRLVGSCCGRHFCSRDWIVGRGGAAGLSSELL